MTFGEKRVVLNSVGISDVGLESRMKNSLAGSYNMSFRHEVRKKGVEHPLAHQGSIQTLHLSLEAGGYSQSQEHGAT